MKALSRRQFLRNGGVAALATSAALTVGRAPAEAAGAAGGTRAGLEGASGAGSTFDGFVNDQGGQVFNATNPAYGAKGDTVMASGGGAVTAGSTSFTSSASSGETSTGAAVSFAAGDVGKVITIQGAGAGGGVLATTIAAYVSSTQVTLADAASTTVTTAAFAYGSDDTAALLAVIAAAGDSGTVLLPAGIYTVLGSSNGGAPITHAGRGGILGQGSKQGANPTFANTVILCSDEGAGLVASGTARYEGFMVDGNGIASAPLQCGSVTGGRASVPNASGAVFFDITVNGSAGTGWAIYGTQNASWYECRITNNAVDGVYIDAGASGLAFYHIEESGNARYGVHGDALVAGPSGATGPTSNVAFYSGILDDSGTSSGVSKVYLRNAENWCLVGLDIAAQQMTGPAIDLDQSAGYGIDLSGSWIWVTAVGTNPGRACVQISGNPPAGVRRTFVKTDGCQFVQGDNSVYILEANGYYEYSAIGWQYDATTYGPVAAPGLPGVDTLLTGRTGAWQSAAAGGGWSGTVQYRIMAEGWVEMKGSVSYSGSGGGTMFTLPAGYRPDTAARQLPAVAGTGLAVVSIATTGDVSANPAEGTAFSSSTVLYFDGMNFPIGGQ